MVADLPAGVVVLNDRYLPADEVCAADVGATSFALNVVRVLADAGLLAGAILYRRCDRSTVPRLHRTVRNGISCLVLEFNFRMEAESISRALAIAIARLGRSCRRPMVYYQTDIMLRFHPAGFAACVTHHGPFYGDFARHYSRAAAGAAFGGREKAAHIAAYQESAIDRLLMDGTLMVIQHSRLQRRYLTLRGVPEERIIEITPPIALAETTRSPPAGRIEDFVRSSRILLYTAVARLDHFKHIELLVAAARILIEAGRPVNVLIIGGGDEMEAERQSLLRDIPPSQRSRFLAVPKFRKDRLHGFFRATRDRAVFVCTSRYETLGITPLEAALSGVCTIMPDLPLVEAARFFPESLKFRRSATDLAAMVDVVATEPGSRGRLLRRSIAGQVSMAAFRADLLAAWREASALSLLEPSMP